MKKNLTVGDDEKKVVKEWFEELEILYVKNLKKLKCCKIQPSFVKNHQANSKESKL